MHAWKGEGAPRASEPAHSHCDRTNPPFHAYLITQNQTIPSAPPPHISPFHQVQYAERAAQRGSPVLALSNCRDALALCCERRRVSRLEDFAALEKLGEVQPPPVPVTGDQKGGAGACAYLGFAGLAADGRRLLDRTRLFAENYRLRHGEDPGVRALALFIAGERWGFGGIAVLGVGLGASWRCAGLV